MGKPPVIRKWAGTPEIAALTEAVRLCGFDGVMAVSVAYRVMRNLPRGWRLTNEPVPLYGDKARSLLASAAATVESESPSQRDDRIRAAAVRRAQADAGFLHPWERDDAIPAAEVSQEAKERERG